MVEDAQVLNIQGPSTFPTQKHTILYYTAAQHGARLSPFCPKRLAAKHTQTHSRHTTVPHSRCTLYYTALLSLFCLKRLVAKHSPDDVGVVEDERVQNVAAALVLAHAAVEHGDGLGELTRPHQVEPFFFYCLLFIVYEYLILFE